MTDSDNLTELNKDGNLHSSGAYVHILVHRCKINSIKVLKVFCGKNRNNIQLTLDISNSKGLSETLGDIRIGTYQSCRREKTINQTTTYNK